MLQHLRLSNVGPAPTMEMDLEPRVNLLTGDNGLGKSFLLDVAWWALTRSWPQEVNRRMTCGLPARPRVMGKSATIRLRVRAKTSDVDYEASYSPTEERWTGKAGRPWIPGLVVYAHADGSFSVWDPARNYWRQEGGVDVQERRRAYVFTEADVWDGLRTEVDGRSVPLCNGLLSDWSTWIRAKDENANAMAAALKALSPGGDDSLKPGGLTRLGDDARDIPCIETSYADDVAILHASSGIRRVIALAYVLTWTWSEHQLAAIRRGEESANRVVMLFDEVESHLHPRWQRSILKALQGIGDTLLGNASLQLVVSTHSPLVLASAEPWFDPEKDAWFDLDLEGERPEAVLRKRQYTPQGTVGAWLTSEAFDLCTDRGSIEAEQAIGKAKALLLEHAPPLDEVTKTHEALRAVLPDVDRFWIRWNDYVERRGGTP